MENFTRYAIYFAPERGPLERFAAEWLGWCPNTGSTLPHPEVAGLPLPVDKITETPRKYGFHGTVKPPFRLAEGCTRDGLEAALAQLCGGLSPVEMPGLRLARLGGFLVLVPEGDTSALAALAAETVESLDAFRAPAGEAEMARRRKSGLSPAQEAYLLDWGYPYVMDEFKFHLTLSGNLSDAQAAQTLAALEPLVTPLLPSPFVVKDLCLFGEAQDGRFHLLHRYALTG